MRKGLSLRVDVAAGRGGDRVGASVFAEGFLFRKGLFLKSGSGAVSLGRGGDEVEGSGVVPSAGAAGVGWAGRGCVEGGAKSGELGVKFCGLEKRGEGLGWSGWAGAPGWVGVVVEACFARKGLFFKALGFAGDSTGVWVFDGGFGAGGVGVGSLGGV